MAGKKIAGTVVSVHQNTAKIQFYRVVEHPMLKKRHRLTFKLLADTAGIEVKAGDAVTVRESRPISRRKRWVVLPQGAA